MALQGLGVVGRKALGMLVEAGAEVIVADIDEEKVGKSGRGVPGGGGGH